MREERGTKRGEGMGTRENNGKKSVESRCNYISNIETVGMLLVREKKRTNGSEEEGQDKVMEG